jgi:hypothetical protein
MSTILRALRRLEEEKAADELLELHDSVVAPAPAPPPRRGRALLFVALAGVLAAAVGAGVTWQLLGGQSRAPVLAARDMRVEEPSDRALESALEVLNPDTAILVDAVDRTARLAPVAAPPPARSAEVDSPYPEISSEVRVHPRPAAAGLLAPEPAPVPPSRAPEEQPVATRGAAPLADSRSAAGMGSVRQARAVSPSAPVREPEPPSTRPVEPAPPDRAAEAVALSDLEPAVAPVVAHAPNRAAERDVEPDPPVAAQVEPESARRWAAGSAGADPEPRVPAGVDPALRARESEAIELAAALPPAEPSRRKSAGVASGIPSVTVTKTVWHPRPERRSAVVEVEGSPGSLDMKEGDAIGDLVLTKIKPSGVVFDYEGVELVRKIGVSP